MKKMDPELAKREFWAAHYYLLLAAEERESSDLVEPLFGLPNSALEAYYFGQLVRPESDAHPLWLPLRDGYSAGVEYADCGDDGHEVRFFLSHESWDEPELLGFDSPHFALPAFRWDELVLLHAALATQVDRRAPAAALLLFPAVYVTAADMSYDVKEHLQEWWRTLTYLSPADPELLVRNVVAYRDNPDVRWRKDEKLGWINDSIYSFRNPNAHM